MTRVVLDLEDRRPVWAMPRWAVDELDAALPEGWELHVSTSPADGSGDGGGDPSAEVLAAVRGARVYIGFGIPEAVLEAGGETLEWVHSGAAGVGSSLYDAMLSSRARFTNSAGIHGPPIAETVVAMVLHFVRGLDLAIAAQARGEWNDTPFLEADTPVRELSALTVGILGYGGIGREIGARMAPLARRVIGLRRSPPEEPVDPHGVRLLSGAEGLRHLLAESDVLVVAVPDTPRTRNLIDRARIRSLPRGALLVNVARGKIVDSGALLDALRDGHLRGAALDVFPTEPLPADDPLWTLPNVLITPHVSAVTHGFWRRQMDLILGNLERLCEGQSLRNEVNRAEGY